MTRFFLAKDAEMKRLEIFIALEYTKYINIQCNNVIMAPSAHIAQRAIGHLKGLHVVSAARSTQGTLQLQMAHSKTAVAGETSIVVVWQRNGKTMERWGPCCFPNGAIFKGPFLGVKKRGFRG